jgi:hypothetical protein
MKSGVMMTVTCHVSVLEFELRAQRPRRQQGLTCLVTAWLAWFDPSRINSTDYLEQGEEEILGMEAQIIMAY